MYEKELKEELTKMWETRILQEGRFCVWKPMNRERKYWTVYGPVN